VAENRHGTTAGEVSQDLLRAADLVGWRRHQHILGRPDFVWFKAKFAIFVDGCFWHGHADCKYFVVPKTRTDFWMGKIMTNMSNDALAVRRLRAMGWKVFTVWECQLKPKLVRQTLARLMGRIVS